MNALAPYMLSAVFPGAGQLYNKQYLKGVLALGVLFTFLILVPIPPEYPYTIAAIWSLADLYYTELKIAGRKKTLIHLLCGLLVLIVVIPSIFYFSLVGIKNINKEVFSSDKTKEEMNLISQALEEYHAYYHAYPESYDRFINSRPIYSDWAKDNWDNPFRYDARDSSHFILTSAGKDEVFDTKDDIIIRNK
jgi:hypothetical protein